MSQLTFGTKHYNKPTPQIIVFWVELITDVLLVASTISFFTKYEIVGAILPLTVVALKKISKFYGEKPIAGEYTEYTSKVPAKLVEEIEEQVVVEEKIKRNDEQAL